MLEENGKCKLASPAIPDRQCAMESGDRHRQARRELEPIQRKKGALNMQEITEASSAADTGLSQAAPRQSANPCQPPPSHSSGIKRALVLDRPDQSPQRGVFSRRYFVIIGRSAASTRIRAKGGNHRPLRTRTGRRENTNMSEKPQSSSTQVVSAISPSSVADSSRSYFCSSVDLKHGLEVVEHDLDDLPASFQEFFNRA
jgi:hypothetical protein